LNRAGKISAAHSFAQRSTNFTSEIPKDLAKVIAGVSKMSMLHHCENTMQASCSPTAISKIMTLYRI
jgi:hypothetical protein